MSEIKLDNTLSVATNFCEKHPEIIYCEEVDIFYTYDSGVYKKISVADLRNTLLKKYSFTKTMTWAQLNIVVKRIGDMKKHNFSEFNTEGVINLENGLFNVNTYTLSKHDKDVLSTIRLPYKYMPDAQCPLWLKSLDEIFEGDKNKLRTLQEFFGYCLTRNTDMEKCLILTGDGANGKTTILHVLRFMTGEDNCSNLSLRYLNDPQKLSVITGKLLNVCGEVPKRIEDFEAEFRSIVTGEHMQVSPKYIPDYTIKPYCKLVMAVNEFPHIDDRTGAFYRRLLIIPLLRSFTEEDQNKNLRNELIVELPGIFNWAIEGLKNLLERKTFLIDEYMKLEIEALKELNNPIMQWCKERILIIPGDELTKGDAYEDYKKWGDKSGHKAFGIAKFSGELYRYFKNNTEEKRRQPHGERKWIWINLALRTPENELRMDEKMENITWEE